MIITLDNNYQRAKRTNLVSRYLEGLHRKISHDIMEVWKRNIQPLYDKEMEEISKKSKDSCGDPTRFEDR